MSRFSRFAAHVDFYLSLGVQTRFSRETNRPLRLFTNYASAVSMLSWSPETHCSALRGCQSCEIDFSFLFGAMALLLSISIPFSIFEDRVFTVCDDTHALSSQR